MKLSIVCPIKNEVTYVGYSIMAGLDHIHEFIYAAAPSNDGTDELLDYVKRRYAGDKMTILRKPEYDFDVHDEKAYNKSFNDCIEKATGDAVFFLHPDMILTNANEIPLIYPSSKALAWWTNLTSFAGDGDIVISRGRATKWKNIQANKMGLHYGGGYGSQEEDFYFSEITGNARNHYGENFKAYPYIVRDSGLKINHYCETKPYRERYEKMRKCLRTLHPAWTQEMIDHSAANHPRVTLESGYGFEFKKSTESKPDVFEKYKDEFDKVLGRKS